MEDDVKELIEKYALQNAVKHGEPPQSGAVMGKLMGEHPELREKAREVAPLVDEVIQNIVDMTPEERLEKLERIAPELLEEEKEEEEEERGLPPLEVEGELVMRFAPNPNGPATLGSARGIVVNSEYVSEYGGTFILRFDDTDPVVKRPMLEAYDWYVEDSEWLGATIDRIVVASERLPTYYEVAEDLIRAGGAYVCFCEQEEFKALKDEKKPCPHRGTSPEENLELWQRMLDGEYDEREAVLRVKTEIEHPDPALRDWVAFRIVKTPHPRVGDEYIVWPLLDFESAVEDHLQNVTHIIRGKDLMDSERRQKYVYDYLGWTYPEVLHWGRIKIHEFGKFSTSKLKEAIEKGEYSGWDDPRLPTVRALKRRGIQAEAIRRFMISLGVSETDISISMDTLYAENKNIVDPRANRYFFTHDPVAMEVKGAKPTTAHPPLHPNDPARGDRSISVGNRVLLAKSDVKHMREGKKYRLKDLYNVEITGTSPLQAKYIGDSVEQAKEEDMRIIHWAPPDGIDVLVKTPRGEETGIGEAGIKKELDNVVQFERYGFVRIDEARDGTVIAYYAHR